MAQEGDELANCSFGPTILAAIGRTYFLCGEAAAGSLLHRPWAVLQQHSQGIRSKFQAARLAIKVRTCISTELMLCASRQLASALGSSAAAQPGHTLQVLGCAACKKGEIGTAQQVRCSRQARA